MGQYYTPLAITENGEKASFHAHKFGNGLKLMEHSYMGNNFVAAVLNWIHTYGPARLWWMGDCSDPSDFENTEIKFSKKELDKINSNVYDVAPREQDENFKKYIVANLTKKEYIDLFDFERGDVCPVPLLTAVGNSRGGGDYWGQCQNEVGSWAGDLLDCSEIVPDAFVQQGFTKKQVFFEEE